MYISLKDSCAKGFNKWADIHQPQIKNDVRTGSDSGLPAASHDPRNLVMTSLERPHRPWLVPVAVTLELIADLTHGEDPDDDAVHDRFCEIHERIEQLSEGGARVEAITAPEPRDPTWAL
jgi:hypothetical protein